MKLYEQLDVTTLLIPFFFVRFEKLVISLFYSQQRICFKYVCCYLRNCYCYYV